VSPDCLRELEGLKLGSNKQGIKRFYFQRYRRLRLRFSLTCY
jgi:hypothetical protein